MANKRLLLIYKAATGLPIPPHVLVMWALTIMTIVLQSGKLWQPTDEDMYADGALLGTRVNVVPIGPTCTSFFFPFFFRVKRGFERVMLEKRSIQDKCINK